MAETPVPSHAFWCKVQAAGQSVTNPQEHVRSTRSMPLERPPRDDLGTLCPARGHAARWGPRAPQPHGRPSDSEGASCGSDCGGLAAGGAGSCGAAGRSVGCGSGAGAGGSGRCAGAAGARAGAGSGVGAVGWAGVGSSGSSSMISGSGSDSGSGALHGGSGSSTSTRLGGGPKMSFKPDLFWESCRSPADVSGFLPSLLARKAARMSSELREPSSSTLAVHTCSPSYVLVLETAPAPSWPQPIGL